MRDEGFAGLYRGLGATLMQARPTAATQLQTHARRTLVMVVANLHKRSGQASGWWTVFCSGCLRQQAQLRRQHMLRTRGNNLSGSEHSYLQVGPSLAINYCAYETSRSVWLSYSDLQSPTMVMSLLCGSFAGLVSSTATFPLDLARRRMQVRAYSWPCTSCRSAVLTLCHSVLSGCAQNSIRPYLPRLRPRRRTALSCSCPLDAAAYVPAADLNGSAAVLQLQGQHGRSDTRCSYTEVFRQIYVQRGLPGLYAGIIPEYSKVIPGVAIAFCSYEVCHGAIVAHRCAALWHTQHQPRGYEGTLAVPPASC